MAIIRISLNVVERTKHFERQNPIASSVAVNMVVDTNGSADQAHILYDDGL